MCHNYLGRNGTTYDHSLRKRSNKKLKIEYATKSHNALPHTSLKQTLGDHW